jgi:helix-turn-helix protein
MTKQFSEQTDAEHQPCALTEQELATLWRISPAALRRMRREGRGPRWTRIGRLIRYPVGWLHEFLQGTASPATPSSQASTHHLTGTGKENQQ